jgi:hypothetical protein
MTDVLQEWPNNGTPRDPGVEVTIVDLQSYVDILGPLDLCLSQPDVDHFRKNRGVVTPNSSKPESTK